MFKAPLKNTLKNVADILGTSRPPQNDGDYVCICMYIYLVYIFCVNYMKYMSYRYQHVRSTHYLFCMYIYIYSLSCLSAYMYFVLFKTMYH